MTFRLIDVYSTNGPAQLRWMDGGWVVDGWMASCPRKRNCLWAGVSFPRITICYGQSLTDLNWCSGVKRKACGCEVSGGEVMRYVTRWKCSG